MSNRFLFGAVMAGMALAASPAASEGWSISKLESMPSEQACMDKARLVINRYLFAYGGGHTGEDTWSLYAYDLEPGMQDAVIICPIGGGGSVNAMLIVQSESEAEDRTTAVTELISIWNSN